MTSQRSIVSWSTVSVALIATSFPALAQDVDPALIEEIVTTARKRDETLQTVPVAVSAFGVEEIANRGLRAIDDIGRFAPGLSFAKAFGRSTDRPVIRGQGNVLAGVQFGVESGAAYFVDGVYYGGDLSSIDISNVERVEVIRGPQAALYGRNTYSGAINFVTRAPGDSTSGSVRARYGTDANQEVNATIRGPLGDTLAGSLTARYYSYDGEYRNVVTDRIVGDEETTSVSGRLDFTPSDGISLSARVSWQEDRDGTRPFFLQPSEMNNCMPGTRSNASWLWSGSSNNNQYYCGEINRPGDTVALNDGPAVRTVLVPGVPDTTLPGWSAFFLPPNLYPGGDPYNELAGVAFSGVERDLLFATLQGEFELAGGWTLIGSVGLRDEDRATGSDSDHSSVNFLPSPFNPNPAPNTVECFLCASGIEKYDETSVELRLESPLDRKTRWMFGAFTYDLTTEGLDILWTSDTPLQTEATTENFAIFASLEHDFTEALSATLELRYFDEEKGLTEFDEDGEPSFTNSFEEVAPRITVNYQAGDALIYGIYAKGYKPGGVIGSDGAELIPPTTTYEQEESDNWEFGIKNTFADGRGTANVAVFFIDASDIQLTTPLPTGGGGTLTSVVTNQGSGETFGLELEMRYIVNDNVTVGANYALADSEFTEGCDDFQWTASSGGGTLLDPEVCTGSNPNSAGSGSIVGNQFPLSSENQFSAYADFRWPLNNSEMFANLSYSWEDKKPVQVHNLAWVPAATIVDLQVGWQSGNFTVMAYGRNLTDEDAPSMVTRWLQEPLLITWAAGPNGSLISPENAGAPAGYCAANPCSTSFPRGFFGDMRMSRNFGIELRYDFGI